MRSSLFCVVLMLSLSACIAPVTSNTGSVAPANAPRYGVQTKTSGCLANNGLPDPACTPGDVLPNVTKNQICVSGYASSVRNVPTEEKTAVYTSYSIPRHNPGQYEVDHLVSLELGGSNAISNLWPELAEPRPGFHEKDSVENFLHAQVCAGAISLSDAQRLIATDWFSVYRSMNGGTPLQLPQASTGQASTGQAVPQPTAEDAARDSGNLGDLSNDQTGTSRESADGSCPANLPVKGNVRRDGTRIYHLPNDSVYNRTHAEMCFATTTAAERGGFRAPKQ